MSQDNNNPYKDPVSFDIMQDACFISVCGHSFSKSTLDEVIRRVHRYDPDPKCPLCRVVFHASDIKPNFALREAIEKYKSDLETEQKAKQAEILLHEEAKAPVILQADAKTADIKTEYEPSINCYTWKNYTNIVIVSPEGSKEISNDIVICLDVSGSMNDSVKRRGEDGKEIDEGLSTLDVVKHSACALIKTMKPSDRLGIVTFSDNSKTIMPMTIMIDSAKEDATKLVKALEPDATTNLMAGITSSFDLLRELPINTNRSSHVCLFTDGMPTDSCAPSCGFKKAITRYFDKWTTFTCSLNMIGFGYQLDSKCLDEETSKQTNGGTYAFIPDGTMIGTIFSHLGGSMAVNAGSNAVLKLEFASEEDAKSALTHNLCDLDMCYDWTRTGSQISIKMGNLHYGQNRSICIPSASHIKSYSLSFTNNQTHKLETLSRDNIEPIEEAVSSDLIESLKAQLFRQMLVSTVRRAMNYMSVNDNDNARKLVQILYKNMTNIGITVGSECAEISKDVTGQISEAFSKKEWYDKWGRHYLPSLVRAHWSQQCNNFKDPGVQRLGGKLFQKVRDKIDDMFNTLPAPTPSRAQNVSSSFSSNASRSIYQTHFPSNLSMSSYSNSYNPCFRGDNLVKMVDGSTKRIDQIKSGDQVSAHKGNYSNNCTDDSYSVKYVIKSACKNFQARFVNYKGLIITPTHPVLNDYNEWCRPIDLVKNISFQESCDYVYNFVLESGHIMNVNGIDCVTLGHGFKGNYHIEHPYFGTQKIVQDLQKISELTHNVSGVITLSSDPLIRDENTGWVIGIDSQQVISID